MRHHRTLRYIDAIARAGSIRGAADALAITPSALNRRLIALEEEIGAPLFERLPRGVRLSSAGELFVHHARRQIAELARVRSQIEDMKGARRGHVTIALDRSLPAHPLAALVAGHRAEHPGVTFAVIPCDRSDAAPMLATYAADMTIALEPDRAPGFTTLATLPVRLGAWVAADHALAGERSVRLGTLCEDRLALAPRGRSIRFLFDLACSRRDLHVEPVIEGPDDVVEPVIAAGEAIGVALGIEAMVAAGAGRTDEGRLRFVPLAAEDARPAYIHLGQLRERALPVAAARFAEIVRAQFEAQGSANT